ncbi:uncharacterized, partial [Tachysurus ichikawai]
MFRHQRLFFSVGRAENEIPPLETFDPPSGISFGGKRLPTGSVTLSSPACTHTVEKEG